MTLELLDIEKCDRMQSVVVGFPKSNRARDKVFLKKIKQLPCFVCGLKPVDPAHIQTRGSGGPDARDNVLPLCRNHHIEQGVLGIRTFCSLYHIPITDSIYPRLTFSWEL